MPVDGVPKAPYFQSIGSNGALSHMRFFRRSLVGLFLLSLTVALLTVGGASVWNALQARWSEEPRDRPARERVFAANVIPLEPGPITPQLRTFGEVLSRRTLDIRAPVSGRIVSLSGDFEEGGRVGAGALLARIDPADAQTAVDVARTDLVEAEADMRDAERALALAGDELEAARAQAELRARALGRQQDLRNRGVGTEAAVETAELAASSADQAVLSRRQAVQSAEARLDQTRTLIDRRKITLADAQRRLSDTEIYAAFDGRLSDVAVSLGGLVNSNERLAQLVDPKALELAFRVSTAQYARLLDQDGALISAPVTITLDVLGADLELTGRLSRESAAVAEGTTGRVLYADIKDPRGLRPGDFVSVSVDEPRLDRVVQVPAAALGNDSTVLALGEEDRLELAEVTLLRRQGDDVILRARGLAGREIVAERSQLLGAGIKIKPLRQGAPEAAEPQTLRLDAARRAKLIAFVEGNRRMPDEVKERMLERLGQEEVPLQMVERLESRMGS